MLDPCWKGKLVSTCPNDDAVLYLDKAIVDQHGWEWLRRFVAQDVACGTRELADRVEASTAAITLHVGGMLIHVGVKSRFVRPKSDPFMAWTQRAAIFKPAPDGGIPQQLTLYVGEVTGASTLGWLGLHDGRG
ncbi:hypothetical protein ACF1G5_25495 [Streptomyces coeruleorubidus]|uniref:hypothetical protein n=1 Tax=Streptomyces coeruleorubidus TaxID=116188 RepID=UPI0036FEFE9A